MDKNNVRVKAALAAASLAAIGFCNSAHASVILSAVYGDGGFSASGSYPASYFQNDYIEELYNNGSTPTSLSGLYLELSTYNTDPIGNNTYEVLALPTTGTMAAGGYYLIQIPDYNGTKPSNFHSSPGQFAEPNPDLVVYSASSVGTPVYDAPYYANGKIGLVSGSPTGSLIDYVGYGTGLVSGSYGTAASYNNAFSTIPGFLAPSAEGTSGYAGAGDSTTGPYVGSILGETGALIRTNTTDTYDPTQSSDGSYGLDNNGDWTYETTFTLTNSSGQSYTATSAVPEPGSLTLLAAGGAMLIARRRQKS